MPTNVTADYKRAEQAFREAREPRERLDCLKEMLRTLPKHKGTEHLQADIKSRIKQLSEELAGPRKGAARTGPSHSVRPDGAAQVALLGPPGAGKSSLHRALTGSHAAPGATREPLPGMFSACDVQFQMVDLPPISAHHMESWIVNALQPADAALLVIDIADPDCLEQVTQVCARLAERRIRLTGNWPGRPVTVPADDDGDPFRIDIPTLLVAGKIDLGDAERDLPALLELLETPLPALAVSAQTGAGLAAVGDFLFEALDIVRVYTKTPGKPAETGKPFAVRRGQTVADVAALVHKDIAENLKYARLWGGGRFDAQQVGPQHEVDDGDVLELHVV